MTVDSKPFCRHETWVERGWGSVLRSHSFIWSGSPHSPPQGPLHDEAQADVLPPLSFSYSESKIALLPQKTTTVTQPSLLTTWRHPVSVFLIKKGRLTPSTTVPTKLDSKYSSKKGSKHYLKSYFPDIGPNILVLL